MSEKIGSILLVEDAESILIAMHDFLMNSYHVSKADSSGEAKKRLAQYYDENKQFDLAVVDIHLPDESGLDLTRFIQKNSPNTKIIIITSYDINEYINSIYDLAISQVLTKHSFFSLKELGISAYKTITGDIFSIKQYFPDMKIYYPTELKRSLVPSDKDLFSVQIKSTEERHFWSDKIANIIIENRPVAESLIKLLLDELTTNAMVRAPRHDDGSFKYQQKVEGKDMLIPLENFTLDEEDYFLLQFGFYNDWIILICTDPHGTLNKKEILYRLKRHISSTNTFNMPDGLNDSHGRGIFILREQLSHLVFNIQKERKTEVICMLNTSHDTPYKNISIYEIE